VNNTLSSFAIVQLHFSFQQVNQTLLESLMQLLNFYSPDNVRECNVSGLMCLIEFNDMLNAEKPQNKNPFFANEEGIECSCLPECNRVEYAVDMSPVYEHTTDKDFVVLDIHFAKKTMMKFRTDVSFSWMDLVVGFGGIVSLFLGCSLVSGAEIVYFSTIALFWSYKKNKSARQEFLKRIKTRFPFLH